MFIKHCPCCDTNKPSDQFGKNRCAPDGLAYYCRVCQAAKARQWREDHPTEAAKIKRRYLDGVRQRNDARTGGEGL